MPHEVMGITTCNLPHPKIPGTVCGAKFVGPQHLVISGALGNGQQTLQQSCLTGLLEKLVKHLVEQHPRVMGEVILQGEQYKGLLMMLNFSTTDKEFQEQRNYYRWSVHQQTLNARLTDERLGLAVAVGVAAALDEWNSIVAGQKELELIIGRDVERMMRDLRDALQEPVEPPNPLAPKVQTL